MFLFLFVSLAHIAIRFIFPLNDSGVLCDVELAVDGERRIGSDVDLDTMKHILEQKETFKVNDEIEVHVIKVGEVPNGSEVTIKCTYVAVLNIAGNFS